MKPKCTATGFDPKFPQNSCTREVGHLGKHRRTAADVDARLLHDASLLNLRRLISLALEKQLRIERLKNANSLANNLCPDHRDKQNDKPCLACVIERRDKTVAALVAALREIADMTELSERASDRTIYSIVRAALVNVKE